MYNLSIEVDNQNVSSGNVDVEGTDFYGCGCQANGQCGAVIGYWDDDVLTVLLSEEGCGASEGQVLSGGGIYDFVEVGSGSLNGDNSFGLSENGVEAYATYLTLEGDDVVISDRQRINATVRFVPVIEEVPGVDQTPDAEVVQGDSSEEEETLLEVPGQGAGVAGDADQEGLQAEEEGQQQQELGSDQEKGLGDDEEEKEVLAPEVGVAGLEEVAEAGDVEDQEVDGLALKEGDQEEVQEESLEDGALAGVLVHGDSVDTAQIAQREETPDAELGQEEEALLEVPGQGAGVAGDADQEGLQAEEEGQQQQELGSDQEKGLGDDEEEKEVLAPEVGVAGLEEVAEDEGDESQEEDDSDHVE